MVEVFSKNFVWNIPSEISISIILVLQATYSINLHLDMVLHIARFKHGIIIKGAGLTYKKIPCYMRDSACRCFFEKSENILKLCKSRNSESLKK